jgi:hypothetical protein
VSAKGESGPVELNFHINILLFRPYSDKEKGGKYMKTMIKYADEPFG